MRSQQLTGASDEALVSAFVDSGDQQALEVLLARHESFVYGLAFRLLGNRADALDATQDVFLTVFRRARSFRHRSSFRTWLYRLTTNACYDLGRRKSRTPQPVDTLPAMPSAGPDADTRIDIERALSRLPIEQRTAVVLRDLYGLSYEEIAESTGNRVGTVKSRIARGRAALASLLQQAEPDAGPRRLKGDIS